MKSDKTHHRAQQPAHPVHPDHASMTQILDESAMLPIHYRIWALSTGGTLLSGVSMFLLGVTLPLVIPILALPATSVGLPAAMLMGGTVIGALVGGHLADHFGRKPVMVMDMILLMTVAMAERARAIEDRDPLALGEALFLANLTDVLTGVLEAPLRPTIPG